MKNRKNIWKIVGILMVVGIILTTIGGLKTQQHGFYFSNTGMHIIKHEAHEEKQFDLEKINNIDINVENLNIVIEEANTYGIEIKTFDDDYELEWKIEDGTLKVNEKTKSKFRIFSFDLSFLNRAYTPYIKVYLPKGEQLNNVSLYTKDSNIQITNLNANDLSIENEYGGVTLETIKAENINIKIKDGKFNSNNVKGNQIVLSCDYGDVDFNEIQSKAITVQVKDGNLTLKDSIVQEIELKSEYGNIFGEALEIINTNIEAKDGNIKLEGDFIGNTQIQSTYGEVNIKTNKDKSYYNLDISTKYGKIIIDEEKIEETKIHTTNQDNGKAFKVVAKDGNIEMNFRK